MHVVIIEIAVNNVFYSDLYCLSISVQSNDSILGCSIPTLQCNLLVGKVTIYACKNIYRPGGLAP
jgi:hypothetical protein